MSFNPDLSLSGGAVESEVLSFEVAVQRETVKNQSGVWRGRQGVLLLICKHTKNESKYEISKIKFPLCENRVCLFFKCVFIPGSGCCGGSPGGGRRGGWT